MAGGDDEELQWTCCNDEQSLFIPLYIAFCALSLVLLPTLIAKPLRLAAVFLHEFSHAIAAWLTCGEVHAIKVYDNEGGVTQYVGGCRCLVIPAGYVGCSVGAALAVILSGGRKTATAAAVLFITALLISLCYQPNATMVRLNLGYAVFMIAAVVIEWFCYTPLLQFVILFFGVSIGIIAIKDIYSGTVIREVEGSDSDACHKEVCPCCSPRCIGLQWILLAVFFQLFGIWLALVEMSNECEHLGWFACLNLSTDFDFELGENFDFDGFWDNGP